MRRVALIGAIAVVAFPALSAGAPPSHTASRARSDPCGRHAWCNTALSAPRRARLVLGAMSLEEKLELVASGSQGIPRLGIPPLVWTDGPNGVGEGATHVTAFPDAETIAASWDPSIALRYGTALGAETAGKGDTLLFAPTVNIVRTPKWGREAETLGEDPFLAGALAASEIRGIQSNHVIAEVKHFAGNNQEVDRFGDPLAGTAVSDQVSDRALQEIYFPAFRAAIQQGHVASALCSYNRINGVYSCQDPSTLKALTGFGLKGLVEPDETLAVRDDVAAANAGVDNFLLGSIATAAGGSDLATLQMAVANGRISHARLDAMAQAVLTSLFSVGLFDHPRVGNRRRIVSTPAHLALARSVAEQATVLLKNAGGVLPLGSHTGSIAVIGHDAGPGTQIEQNGSAAVLHGPVISPLSAIRARAGSRVRVRYAAGTLGVVPLPAIPTTALSPSSGAGHGLSASYYSGASPGGTPILVRTDPNIDFEGKPAPLLPIPGTSAHSARWTGTLTAAASGLYRFSLTMAGEARLYLGGRLIVSGNSEFSEDSLANSTLRSPGGPVISFQGTARLRRSQRVPIRVEYSTGSSVAGAALTVGWQPPDPSLLARAVTAARRSRAAIVFASDVTSEGMDRTSLELAGDQDRLIQAVGAANPNTIVVLHTAGPVLMPWLSRVAGVLEAWYPGQQSGAAIAATLFGDADPAGRLPVTFPASERQGPATKPSEYPGINNVARYDEGIFVGYRYYDRFHQRPLFPFGFGLSYTRFSLGRLQVRARRGGRWTASVPVRDTGPRSGAEVLELYVGFPRAAGEPPGQLKAFGKVFLSPGQTRTVTLTLDRSSFSTWRQPRGWTVIPGRYVIRVGTSSRDLLRQKGITVR
jgi:beta-glucosidase